MPIRTNTHTHTRQHKHTHANIRTHTYTPAYTHMNRGNVQEQTPTPASPSMTNSLYQPQPAQPSPTNQLTPTSAIPSRSKYHPSVFSLALLHQPTFLPRTYAQPSPSTLSLTPFTNLRLSLAPTRSLLRQRSLSD
jgi:hypothetical protein